MVRYVSYHMLLKVYNPVYHTICWFGLKNTFMDLPKASFSLQVLSLPASVCMPMCVCMWCIPRMHGCVQNDSETHETVLLKCHFTNTRAFLLIWWSYLKLHIFFKFAVYFITLMNLDETKNRWLFLPKLDVSVLIILPKLDVSGQ